MSAFKLQTKKITGEELRSYPGNYSEEEIIQSCVEIVEAFERGDRERFIPHEQIKRKHL